jgi:hypothetical protein
LDEEFETINIGIIVAKQINKQHQPTFTFTPLRRTFSQFDGEREIIMGLSQTLNELTATRQRENEYLIEELKLQQVSEFIEVLDHPVKHQILL